MRMIPVAELVVAVIMMVAIVALRKLARSVFHRSDRPAKTARALRPGLTDDMRNRARLIVSSIGIALISVPLILEVVPPNGLYGFRNRLTQSSPSIWYSANAFMGWALLIAALLSAVLLWHLPQTTRRWLLWATLVGPVGMAIAASFVYLSGLG